MYVADLDAIIRGERDVQSWRVAATGVSLLIDAGVRSVAEASELAGLLAREFRTAQFVIGLESLHKLDELSAACRTRLQPSSNKPCSVSISSPACPSPDADWRNASALGNSQRSCTFRIVRLIVLDLADVGSGQGTSTLLVREIHGQFPNLKIIAGGGVRSAFDLQQLEDAGASAALVASAAPRRPADAC